jgi:hypothetical protein
LATSTAEELNISVRNIRYGKFSTEKKKKVKVKLSL